MGSFRVGEVELRGGHEAHQAEDDEHGVANVHKSWGNIEAEGEAVERGVSGRVFSSFLEVFSYVETESYLLENPVAFCSDTHADCAGFQAPNLCRINPTNWCERHGVDDDEHVREGNDGCD